MGGEKIMEDTQYPHQTLPGPLPPIKRKSKWKLKLGVIIGAVLILVGIYYGLYFFQNVNVLTDKQLNDTLKEYYYAGLLYTSQTGNVTFLNNNTLESVPIPTLCNYLIQNQGAQNGG